MNVFVIAAVGLTVVVAIPYLAFLGIYVLVRPEGSPANKQPWEPTVSVVLPTYNESSIIDKKLDDLMNLDYPMEKVEVVVVDSSDDGTPELIESYFEDREYPTLNVIREKERRGLAPALNDAYSAAENEMVVKTDCDSYLPSNVLREAAANLSDPEVAAVTGRNAEVLGGSEVEEGYRGIQAHIQTLESHLDSTLIFHGPFSAFENEAIVPIDPNSLADDTELALKIRRNGGRVVFDPAVAYKEASHSAFGKRRTQKDRRGMGLIRLLFQHRDALGKYGKFGRVVLPFNWWFMIISPWILFTDVLMIMIAAFMLMGAASIILPLVLGAIIWLGQRDNLGPLEPIYSLLDAQISLGFASITLIRGGSDGTWEVDTELRNMFD